MSNEGIVIVGGGIAGQALVEAIREHDRGVAVTLVCGEPRLPYDRVRLSELLVSGEDPDDLVLRPAEWFIDRGVRVLTGRRVARLALERGAVELEDGETLPFGRLALATGSLPLLPPIPGIDLDGVHAFRGPEDCDAIRLAAASGDVSHAVVIGGGLLGLEAARGIVAQGCPVTVVHLMGRVMERQLDAGAAELLLPRLRELGVGVLLERQTDAIVGDGRVSAVRFRDGEELDADLVVVSIGIRPEASLAREARLDCERGIVVDDEMRTSCPEVVAVGECAEHDHVVYGLVAPIIQQARVAAATLLGRRGDPYRGSVPSAKLKVAGIDLVAIGAAEGDSEAISFDAGAGVYRKLVVRDGLAAGAVLLGDVRGSEALLAEIAAAEPQPDPIGRLAAAAALGPEDLPDGAQVCNCNSVSKGELVAAVHEGGCGTPREVMARTRAGTGCGSCRTSVIAIVAAATGGRGDEPAYLCACERQTREQVADSIREHGWRSVTEVADGCRTGRECGACKPALAYLVSELGDNRHHEERHARFINDRVHANIQRDGTFSVVPRIHGGVVTPDQLRRIADAAEKYAVPMVKVTGGQRIDLLGVRKEDLPAIWRDLGMTSGYAYSKAVRTVKTCVGTDFCRYGLGDSIALGIEMEKAWEGLHTPHKVKSGVSGCPRNCAEATVKDIGVVALEGAWQVRIAGAAGGTVREGDVLCTVKTRAEALRVTTAFLQYYREHARFKERTYDFVPRIGLDQIRDAVLDERSSAMLLERLRIAKAATRDAWLERDDPYHPRQFRDLDDSRPSSDAGQASDDREPAVVGPPTEDAWK